jgi:hypothetical protein
MGKKQNEAITNAVTGVMKAVETTIKDESKKLKTPTIKSLEDLKNHYETVDVRLRKRDNKTGKFMHLVQMDRQPPSELEAIGLEEVCKDQAGGGEYQVLIKDPNTRSWAGAMKFDGIHVAGMSYDMAKADRMGMNSVSGALPNAAASGYSPPPWQFQKGNNEMKDIMKAQMEQSTGMSDRIMLMMNNSNQQQMQMMQTLMAAMVGNNNNNKSEDSEVRVLKERIERMEQERKADERYAMLAKEQAELKQQLLLAAATPKQDKSNELLLALLTAQQTQQQAASGQYVDLVKEMIQRPSEDEKISNITGTMIRSFQGQMDLMNSALRNGLLSSGGSEHPVAQIVSQALEGLTQVATVAFEAKGAAAGAEEEMHYDTAPAEVGPMPSYEESPPVAELGYVAPDPQLPEHEESAAQEVAEPEIREEDILLDAEALNRISRDTALSQVLAKIQNGIPIVEATARLYAHARANNDIAIKWLSYPDIISRQVLTYYGMEHSIDSLAKNIVDFLTFLSQDGDPNKWAEITGYKPIKEARAGNVTSVIPPTDAPEFGVTRKAPVQGEEYDSANPTSLTPPTDVDVQPATVDDIPPATEEEIPSSVGETPTQEQEVAPIA